MKVLVVEDSITMRTYLQRQLERMGHEMVACADAESALAAFEAGDFTLILLDWILPGMDGLEFCRRIRSMPSGDRAIVIMITSRNRPEDLDAVLDAGADDYIAKPIDRALLHTRLTVAERMVRNLTERKRAEDALKQSLDDKDMLIREVHHRAKNNLMIIQSLLNLQSHEIVDSAARDKFQESQNRVKAMRMIHERLYRKKDLTSINVGEYLRSLALEVFKSYCLGVQRVRLESEMRDATVDVEAVIPLGLILNELVSNAMKYAFPEGRPGVLRVGFEISGEGMCVLTVSDDGVGLPEGFDLAATESLGMQLITTLTAQIAASLDLDRTGGTTFRIKFHEGALLK
jgi:two-component sensor histidine kinase